MRSLRLLLMVMLIGMLTLAVAVPAQAVTPPFPATWACEAPPAGAAWQAWHCKVTVRGVLASRNPSKPLWAINVARGRLVEQAAALGITLEGTPSGGCQWIKANRWRCTLLTSVPYVP